MLEVELLVMDQSKRRIEMEYIKVFWKHNFSDEPVTLYSELDANRNELRKIEIYRDGSCGYAFNNISYKNTRLSEEPLPTIEEIAKEKEFEPHIISKGEFEIVWNRKVKL